MKALELFKKIEDEIPKDLALKDDFVGYIGKSSNLSYDIERVLILMDYVPHLNDINYSDYDLLILHHPPFNHPNNFKAPELELPTYVIHSNWDIIKGGACDALADSLNIDITGILDPQTGLGRIGIIKNGPISVTEFVNNVSAALKLNQLKTVNNDNALIEKIALVSGFGLSPSYIQKAYDKNVDLYLSGDLTHAGAIMAKKIGIRLLDVSHHASEVPGLYRLGELISRMGVDVKVKDSGIPWKAYYFK